MNILVLSWRGPGHPLAGGAEQSMHEHMKGWIEAGHEVTLLTSHYKGGKRKEEIDGVKIIRRGYQLLGVHLYAFYWYFFGNHKKFDLIVDQFHGIPFFSVLYSRLPKVAVVQEVAREVWLNNDLPWPFNKIIGWIGYITEPVVYFLYRNTTIMTGSQSAKDDLFKMGVNKNKIHIVEHGVLLEKVSSKIKKNPPAGGVKTVMFLGALSIDKGVVDAVDAFGKLNKMGDYQFWVVGKGGEPMQRLLEEKVENLGIKNNTKFWGFVSKQKKFELLKQSHVLINPSLLEGWGLVNIEANAMGTPVVGYTSKGLVDSIQHNKTGILVKNNTPQNLAKAIHKLLEDEEKYNKLSKNAIKWSENFDWKKSRKKSLKLISSVQ